MPRSGGRGIRTPAESVYLRSEEIKRNLVPGTTLFSQLVQDDYVMGNPDASIPTRADPNSECRFPMSRIHHHGM